MPKCLKTYGVGGSIPDELNEDVAYRIGRAFAQILQQEEVVVGRDV